MNGTASMGSPSLISEDSSLQQYVYEVKYSMYVWSHTEFPFTFSSGVKNSNHDSLIGFNVTIKDDAPTKIKINEDGVYITERDDRSFDGDNGNTLNYLAKQNGTREIKPTNNTGEDMVFTWDPIRNSYNLESAGGSMM